MGRRLARDVPPKHNSQAQRATESACKSPCSTTQQTLCILERRRRKRASPRGRKPVGTRMTRRRSRCIQSRAHMRPRRRRRFRRRCVCQAFDMPCSARLFRHRSRTRTRVRCRYSLARRCRTALNVRDTFSRSRRRSCPCIADLMRNSQSNRLGKGVGKSHWVHCQSTASRRRSLRRPCTSRLPRRRHPSDRGTPKDCRLGGNSDSRCMRRSQTGCTFRSACRVGLRRGAKHPRSHP